MPLHSVDTPVSEITLRRYEKPLGLSGRDLLRRICLSLGILQPGDSRDIIIDILGVLLTYSPEKKFLTSEQIRELVIKSRTNNSLDLKGLAPSNLRRQLKRLRDLQIIEKIKNEYRITEFMKLSEIFDERIKPLILNPIISRVDEYISLYEN